MDCIAFVSVVLTYRVEVFTGNLPDAGTDANVHVMLVGERGDTGHRRLLKPVSNDRPRPFQPRQVIIVLCELNMHVFYCLTVAPCVKCQMFWNYVVVISVFQQMSKDSN